jgi:predicted nucleotidyltransferase
VSATARLLEVTDALAEAGCRFLIMGGHAVRYYGIDRKTFDFDFFLSAEEAPDLANRLRRTRLFSQGGLTAVESWRGQDFQRFQIGVLPNGKEEWLEFWFRNHLLAPFGELYARRETAKIEGRRLNFLGLPDLIRSKETERDDDWSDVRLLEEILDNRNLALAADDEQRVRALAQLRSRRGFERADAAGLLAGKENLAPAMMLARHPVTCAYLLPYSHQAGLAAPEAPLDAVVRDVLRRVVPGSSRHLAVVEAVRLAYQRAAKAADQADKRRVRSLQ